MDYNSKNVYLWNYFQLFYTNIELFLACKYLILFTLCNKL